MSTGSETLASTRTRREKKDKTGRFAALEKFKGLKGSKNKYTVEDEVDRVWDEVDEVEYSKRVRERQDDDWIVDDDGSGYVEDGREIFDDDMNESDKNAKKGRNESKMKKERIDLKPSSSKSSNSITKMFQNLPTKKKKKPEDSVKLEGDSCLDEILADLNNQPILTATPQSSRVVLKKKKKCLSSMITPPLFRTPTTPLSTPTRMRSNRLVYPRSIMTSPSVQFEKVITDYEEENDALDQTIPNEVLDQTIPDDFDDGGISDSMFLSEVMEIEQVEAGVTIKNEMKMETESPKALELPEKKVSYDEKVLADLELDTNHELFDVANQEVVSVSIPADGLPLKKNDKGEDVLYFFWIDAFEDQFKQPGTVYLFGKVQLETPGSFVSCCIIVKNINRQVYILPREKRLNKKSGELTEELITMNDVYNEVDQIIANKFKIQEYKSRPIKKNYAFGNLDVPRESEYLEIKYSANYSALPSNLSGESFSHVFGTTTSGLELLLLGQKIRGPCWLQIKNLERVEPPVSWCKLEAVVQKMEFLEPLRNFQPMPPITVLSLSLLTVMNPKNHQTEIVSCVGLSHNKYHLEKAAPKPLYQTQFCVMTKPSDCIFPFDFREKMTSMKFKVELAENERALISLAITKIYKMDPDIIVGHDIASFDLDVLLHRISTCKVSNWSRIGRLRRSLLPQQSGAGRIQQAVSGRLICDIKLSAKELIQSKSYELSDLSQIILGKQRMNVNAEQIKLAFNQSQQLISLIHYNLKTALLNLELLSELNILPLATQITSVAGNVLSRTLLGGRSERNEFLLLHAFTEKSYIVPDKYSKKSKQSNNQQYKDGELDESKKTADRKKSTYAGGLVLDPKKGFYDKYVLLMDFNSLYPSIIQEYNICFTTVPAPNNPEEDVDEFDLLLPDPNVEQGVLPTEIRKLVESRREVKKLLKNPNLSSELKLQYEIRQKALKLMANSMYGCLGFSNARFYAKHLAAMVTGYGRKILMQTKELVEKQMNLEVLYGDTDSLMINTNCCDYNSVIKIGLKIKLEVNKLYRCLEIDTDAIFKSLLLLKKKKYAALKITSENGGSITTSAEIKGLDVVRRDWAKLASDTGKFVIDELLSGKSREEKIEVIISHLENVAAKIKNNEIPLEGLSIIKQLTKNPEDYNDKKGLPHVNVAVRLNSKRGKKLRQGDTVPYLICQDGSNLAATQRAYHPEELKMNENLKIDTVYYLANQIHPVISRICNPIEELDAARIAECLGLDSSSYKSKTSFENDDNEDSTLGGWTQMSDEEKFKDCTRLSYSCPVCKEDVTVEGIFTGSDLEMKAAINHCKNPSCKVTSTAIYRVLYEKLIQTLRLFIKQYYRGNMVCDMTGCGYQSTSISLAFAEMKYRCPICEKGRLEQEFPASKLHKQLSYFIYLFDVDRLFEKLSSTAKGVAESLLTKDDRKSLLLLKKTAEEYMALNAYNFVDMKRLFY